MSAVATVWGSVGMYMYTLIIFIPVRDIMRPLWIKSQLVFLHRVATSMSNPQPGGPGYCISGASSLDVVSLKTDESHLPDGCVVYQLLDGLSFRTI